MTFHTSYFPRRPARDRLVIVFRVIIAPRCRGKLQSIRLSLLPTFSNGHGPDRGSRAAITSPSDRQGSLRPSLTSCARSSSSQRISGYFSYREMILAQARLLQYLRNNLDGFPRVSSLRILQFTHGQSNPTYLLEVINAITSRLVCTRSGELCALRLLVSTQAGDWKLVLRKKPPGQVLSSAHAVDREYAVLQALQGSNVPVPRARLLCKDAEVIGTPFYVMDFVQVPTC